MIFVSFRVRGGSSRSSCPDTDLECIERNLSESDRLGLEAIRLLHGQLDDDDNGNVDLSESDDVSFPIIKRLKVELNIRVRISKSILYSIL